MRYGRSTTVRYGNFTAVRCGRPTAEGVIGLLLEVW